MGAVLVIAAKDLRQRLRDRSAIVLGFLAPLMFATVMSFAFQGTKEFHADLGVVDADEGALAAAFLDTLEAPSWLASSPSRCWTARPRHANRSTRAMSPRRSWSRPGSRLPRPMVSRHRYVC